MALGRKKKEQEPEAEQPAAKTKSDRTRADAMAPDKVSIREKISRRLMSIGFFRRRYVKRMLKYLDKQEEKGNRLTPEMYQLKRYLAQVPKQERASRMEEALTSQNNQEQVLGNRDLRRATANQNRRSGTGHGYRPGMAPRSMQPGPRPSKRPR